MATLRIKDQKTIRSLVQKGMLDQSAMPVKPRKDKAAKLLCPIPPVEPAHRLYQAVVARFGRLYDGGEAVFELAFPSFKRKYRVDIALPAYKVCVEMDGWIYHGRTLSGFQRDREKSLEFERKGWRVIRFSNKQVREELDDVICAIAEVVSHCTYRPELKAMIKHVAFDRSAFAPIPTD